MPKHRDFGNIAANTKHGLDHITTGIYNTFLTAFQFGFKDAHDPETTVCNGVIRILAHHDYAFAQAGFKTFRQLPAHNNTAIICTTEEASLNDIIRIKAQRQFTLRINTQQ